MTVNWLLTPVAAGYGRLTSTRIIPQTNTQFGDRSFAVAGPELWNTLPVELRQPDVELVTFQWLLKTHCLSVTQAHSDFYYYYYYYYYYY